MLYAQYLVSLKKPLRSKMQKQLITLLTVLPASRDAAWERSFLQMLPQALVSVINPEPQTGPDSWPYLFIEISEKSTEPFARVIDWLTERGVGLTINPQKAIPDFVLTYGMLCNFRMNGSLLTELADFGANELHAENKQIFIAEPNDRYLPSYMRNILRDFFKDQKVLKPRLTLISQDKKVYDLAFSLESLGSPPVHEHAGISEAIAWFLPAHYGIVLISEKRISGFVDL